MRITAIILIGLLLIGCGKAKPVATKPADKIIATVNGEPIYNKDLKQALALRLKNDPSFKVAPNTLKEQINLIIDERLALQHKEKSNSRIEILTK
ncbi:MAG: hypothetical protein Q8R05_05720 [Candidatus Omnitrophota bacterium]|nr:hypothetical protein [Candidatus Omnitrophota bacterium]